MDLQFDIQLEDRSPDRVVVSVLLGPGDAPEALVEGVAILLVDRAGEPLSTRLVLPIAGRLQQPVLTTVELRGRTQLPTGTRVLATAWSDGLRYETPHSGRPRHSLESHLRGALSLHLRDAEGFIETLNPDAKRSLILEFPWLARVACDPTVVDSATPSPEVEEFQAFCKDLGLEEDDADWLTELLDEP